MLLVKRILPLSAEILPLSPKSELV